MVGESLLAFRETRAHSIERALNDDGFRLRINSLQDVDVGGSVRSDMSLKPRVRELRRETANSCS
jgi:hypothetical protein